MWRLILLFVCFSFSVLAKDASNAITKKQHSIIVKFDFIIDEDVDDSDPRLKSIIYSAKSYANSIVLINYINPEASNLATTLSKIFINHGLKVLNEEGKSSTRFNNQYSKNVLVVINY